MKAIIVLSSLAFSAACFGQEAAEKPAPAKLAIVSASFGSGDMLIDVTKPVRSLVSHEIALLRAPWALGTSDPAPGRAKQVNIVYLLKGVECKATFAQNQHIVLPPPPEKGLVIVNASFGIDDRRVDVTESLRSQVKEDQVYVPHVWTWKISDVDPMEGVVKNLKVTYLNNGRLDVATFSEKAAIVLPKPPVEITENSQPVRVE